MKYLYRYKASELSNEHAESEKVNIAALTVLGGCKLPKEKVGIKTVAVRIFFSLITFGKAKIFYVLDDTNGKVVHTSLVIPKCWKFTFLTQNDYEIGPCFTAPNYRGQGIYPRVLRLVC